MEIIRYSPTGMEKIKAFLIRKNQGIFIDSYTKINERCVLYELAKKQKKGFRAAEIGSFEGATAMVIGQAAMERNGSLLCVDTFCSTGMPGKKRDTFRVFFKNVASYRRYVHYRKGLSLEIARNYKGEGFDFLFIDGDHSYEGVTADIQAWMPLCNRDATIVFHDYGGNYGRPAIRKAVKELVFPVQNGPGYCFESLYWTVYNGGEK